MEGCKDFREQLSLYIDGMLMQHESLLLEEHIKECEGCRRELEILREMVEDCRNLEEKEPPEHLYPMIVSGLRKSQKRTAVGIARKKWMKPGLVTVAAVLLIAVAAKGIIPNLYMSSKSTQDMASPAGAPAEEGYDTDMASGEFRLSMAQEGRGTDSGGAVYGDGNVVLKESEMKADERVFTAQGTPPETGDKRIAISDGRKIIKNAELSIEVEDFNQQYDTIQKMVDETGGYIESSNSYVRKYGTAEGDREYMEGHVVIRIPNTDFGSCIERISSLGKVTNRSTYGNDITLQYMDTDMRLKSKQVQQERLLEIMEKATLVEDILRIENELNRVRTEIESYGTQLRGWDNLVQYSTINIFMKEVEPKDTQVSTLKMGSLWDRMKRGFIRTTNGLMDMIEMIIVGIGYALPVIILLGVVYLGWTRFRRNKIQ